MTITTPNNNGQLARWLNRKGDLCFEVAFFATAAISFVALGAVIIALSLVVGGLLVAGVVLFGAADMVGEKVNKVAPPVQSQAPTNETTKQRGTSKQEGAAKQIYVQKKDDDAQGNDDDTQNEDGPKKNRWKKQQKTVQPNPTGIQTLKLRPTSDRERVLCLNKGQEMERKMDCTGRKSNIDKGGRYERLSFGYRQTTNLLNDEDLGVKTLESIAPKAETLR